MDLRQAKILLDKINSLYRSIDMDNGQIAPIERDLMLNYLRQLYELFLSGDAEKREEAKTAMRENRPPAPPKAESDTGGPRLEDPPRQESAPPRRDPAPQPEPKPRAEPRQPASSGSSPEDRPNDDRWQLINQLFDAKPAMELSEKLSEQPIQDLSRSMSINDRLLYMNELFGRDMNALEETLRTLNRYERLEDAKGLIITLADQYNWTEEEKIDTARSFIKLIRRRYL